MVAEVVLTVEVGVAESAVEMSIRVDVVIRTGFVSIEFSVADCHRTEGKEVSKRSFTQATVLVQEKNLLAFTPNVIRRHSEVLEEGILRSELPLFAIPTDVPARIFIVPPVCRTHSEFAAFGERK